MSPLMNRISAINVNVTGTMDLGIHNNSLHIRNLTLNYVIEAFRVSADNIFYSTIIHNSTASVV
jgi:hypothetical protein